MVHDLSMKALQVPGLRDYTPDLGTLKDIGTSLTTLEVVNNMSLPYRRKFLLTDGDTIAGPVEADATICYTATSSQILDLKAIQGKEGVRLDFVLDGTGSLQLLLSNDGGDDNTITINSANPICTIFPRMITDSQSGWVVSFSGASLIDIVYPVGSLYWSSKPTNPATLFGGTWTQIKDKFVLACGDTYNNGATGGSANTTLTTANLPSHTHGFTPAGTVSAHAHGLNSHTHSFTPRGTVSGHSHPAGSLATSSAGSHTHSITGYEVGDGLYALNGAGLVRINDRNPEIASAGAHTHSITGNTANATPTFSGTAGTTGQASGNTANATPTFSGTAGNTSATGSGTSFSNLPPYVVKYCWERTA